MNETELAIMAVSTIAGPILAVQAQKWIERATERRRMRRAIFLALMTNRATRLNDDFIRALNQIDFEFAPGRFGGVKDRAVINAWRSLFGEYQSGPSAGAPDVQFVAWNDRVADRLVSLLAAMSAALGYDFGEEQLRRGIYYPQGRMDLEQTQLAILRGVRQLVAGDAIPMKITEVPSSPELLAAQIDMMQKSAKSYSKDGPVMVRLVGADEGNAPDTSGLSG